MELSRVLILSPSDEEDEINVNLEQGQLASSHRAELTNASVPRPTLLFEWAFTIFRMVVRGTVRGFLRVTGYIRAIATS